MAEWDRRRLRKLEGILSVVLRTRCEGWRESTELYVSKDEDGAGGGSLVVTCVLLHQERCVATSPAAAPQRGGLHKVGKKQL